jgi:EAL domain-containing protein (putative c-di-GMP-specific phosphodiesterase class I)
LAQSRNDRSLVKAIVDLAHGLGAAVIAKHVNTEHTRTILKRYHADYIQGYHFGQPAPIGQRSTVATDASPTS